MTTEASDGGTDGSATQVATGRLHHGTRDVAEPGESGGGPRDEPWWKEDTSCG